MAVQLPYFQPISWEQANPFLTGAQQGQQMVSTGLDQQLQRLQMPILQAQGQYAPYIQEWTAKGLENQAKYGNINALGALVANPSFWVSSIFGGNKQAYTNVLDALTEQARNAASTSGESDIPSPQGSQNNYGSPQSIASTLPSPTIKSNNSSTSSNAPRKVPDSDNAGLADYTSGKNSNSSSPTYQGDNKKMGNGKIAYKLSDGSWVW